MLSYITPILVAGTIVAAVVFLPDWGKKAGPPYYKSEYGEHEFMENGPMGRGYYYSTRARGKGGK